jgi:hypothetical protein
LTLVIFRLVYTTRKCLTAGVPKCLTAGVFAFAGDHLAGVFQIAGGNCRYPRRFPRIAGANDLAQAVCKFAGGNLLQRWRFQFRQGYCLGAPVVLITELKK